MEYNELEYKTHEPELKESWSNGVIAFAAHPPILRETPCYLIGIEGCHDKRHVGWIKDCGSGYHKWELNFSRSNSLWHYHCFYCGIATDKNYWEMRFPLFRNGPKVPRNWIQELEQPSGT